jgi:hypothetical protein
LASGVIGGNLLSKYSMIGRFYVAQESIDFLQMALAVTLRETSEGFTDDKIEAVMGYLRAVILHAPFAESLSAVSQWSTLYDVEGWVRDRYQKDLGMYRYAAAMTFTMTTEPDRKALIQNRIQTFGEHPSGLGKFTRTVFARDLRRTLVPVEIPVSATA